MVTAAIVIRSFGQLMDHGATRTYVLATTDGAARGSVHCPS